MNHSDAILDRLLSLHPKVIDLSLDRMWRLLAALDHPERRIPPVIHIAGTNGKGSTLAMIRAGLEAGGARVHAYTSPHLARFHERIRLAGDLIGEPDLAAALRECEAANDGQPITFFEITTAAAFLAFSRTRADYTLLEVGLGGRLDATNVIARPQLTVITPVSIDHTQYLGDTLDLIAAEKAGIIKPRIPCVTGPQPDPALRVIESRASGLTAPLFAHGQHWMIARDRDGMVYQDDHGLWDLPVPNLIGPHQIQNAGTALAALRQLGATDAQALAAVTRAEWPARMQRLTRGPLVEAAGPEAELWLDGGHNPAGAEALAQTLAALPPRPTHLVCGMLNTKDVAGYMRPLSGHAESLTAIDIPGEANTLPAAETARIAREAGLEAATAADAKDAIARIAAARPRARILICGSLYLAGRVLVQNG
ncbi:MAG: folylpolyglutamate synthase/dihydrofolate synthase family protein [Paracoccus sp. (in: a-proteobacteria)]|uniref:bifunctional folylpolyglutamate synthase/dihydrofolate synthase n=1 Tax=unclassified Paracoccus (in: a-proteobacteria) TaxID=2688777 RepID=UPI000C4859BE|nr:MULTISPECIES: folylpolyglutamate synthase/dihydrofolate synthase family protein [unclassified Paracoccus (in: a-proteobacteria)]MAN55656.1 bifunctional folylpolyglutamate synthase/dihydrofolate synthase [Paracoccus sp. (in: a-proteobacteria)]MBA47756.1 bifunctional folylpolyglutamate synthase/dihydrofolate synthase [Paracoccus sp. (in: a-proteobacteria)]|tara:strand:- start:574 stop:1845 length:1272 start_codon:yes stop_codon:yes gene_type:complete